MELQQNPLYFGYIRKLKWQTSRLSAGTLIWRRFPFGGLAKFQRSRKLPAVTETVTVLKSLGIKNLAAEPDNCVTQDDFDNFVAGLRSQGVRMNRDPFLPTKSTVVDLNRTEAEIFSGFSPAKRRNIRKAVKNGVSVRQSGSISDFIRIKARSAGMLGSLTTYGLSEIYEVMGPRRTAILLAGIPRGPRLLTVAGVFIITVAPRSYYWVAGSIRQGKQAAAPSLLAWEAIRIAKSRGCRIFDFVGVWDERIPRRNRNWLGFTRFKEGFGGTDIYYPVVR
ncbi:hypothetical protein A2Z33_05350 [Candidatus Gottesmanbacteria bacterium RBG_16_52_11]|uniref:BioF2-like acetyltransferase domain-containing protein n=1 Tax=Candidatus Gottesmanbacteria bacterium RBG_16_52_11 TaxID=1798374 RepID=A0A1F5YM99_9BACT|nr:MAG: hypothetical protein A2Z33_05350 [Candidatus Gottesmanbacteria bacterium RBG_16_52_11]